MREKIKGLLAGMVFRLIALLTLGKISPILSACAIIEREGSILLIDRSDGLGFTIPGGIVRYRETVEECVLREVREETGYDIEIQGIVGVYSGLQRDPRFRAVSLAYRASITGGAARNSLEGASCWCRPVEVAGSMAFDCEQMLNDYLAGVQRCS
jgi:8-oxo-dGTP diphosphatase